MTISPSWEVFITIPISSLLQALTWLHKISKGKNGRFAVVLVKIWFIKNCFINYEILKYY